jgi:hypothetical protein
VAVAALLASICFLLLGGTTADEDRSAALALEQAIYGDLFQVVPRFGTWNKNVAPN